MKKIIFLITIAVLAAVLIACSTPANNTNNARNMNANNTNANVPVNTNANANSNRWNSRISKEEYEKDRARYEAAKDKDTWGSSIEESWLWFKVRSALMTTDDLRESTINVDVTKDVVTLKGTVRDEAQKKKAAEVAKVDGVASVKNELKVAPKDSITNTNLSMTDSDKTPAPKK